MAVTVKKVQLWRTELTNKAGTLAKALEPIAQAGADLTVVMGYVFPGNAKKAALEVYPVTTAKAQTAARKAGLKPATDIPCLLIEGDNRAGIGHQMTSALSNAKINLGFFVVQVIGNRFTGVIGFDKEADLKRGEAIIKSAVKAGKVTPIKKAAGPSKVAAQKTASRKSAKKAAPAARKAAAKKPAPRKPTASSRSTAAKRKPAKRK